MNLPTVKPISAAERKLWGKHNIDILRSWRAIPFTKKIQMLEEIEEVARAFHGGKLPRSADEHEEES